MIHLILTNAIRVNLSIRLKIEYKEKIKKAKERIILLLVNKFHIVKIML